MLYLWFLGMLLFTVDAHAQWVNSYGNSLDQYRSYYIPRDSFGYRKPDGSIDTPPILPKREEPFSSHRPAIAATPQLVPRTYEEPYNILTEKVPGRDYRSGSLLRDRVK